MRAIAARSRSLRAVAFTSDHRATTLARKADCGAVVAKPVKIVGLAIGVLVAIMAGAVALAPIAPLLPKTGKSVCFRRNFSAAPEITFGRTMDAERPAKPMRAMSLRLTLRPGQTAYTSGASGYRFDWRYDFAVALDTGDRENYTGGGQCDWTNNRLSQHQFDLACFVDCDGGLLNAIRVPGAQALYVSLQQLRVAGSCGDPSSYLTTAGSGMYRLDAARPEDCSGFGPVRGERQAVLHQNLQSSR